jgi:flagellar hook assembly protein FlgD
VASVSDERGVSSSPRGIRLGQNYPNPFNGKTSISLALEKPYNTLVVRIFDVLGREVHAIPLSSLPIGSHLLEWDGKDGRGRVMSSGIYIYTLDGPAVKVAKKMILAR